jgi:hypothetical protein
MKDKDRFTTCNTTVSAAVSDGFSVITEVGEEFREIYDNAPESLQQSDVNQTRDNTASEIENLSEPDIPDVLEGVPCTYIEDNGKVYRGRRSQSRACRATNGAGMLRAAAEGAEAWLSEHEELPEEGTAAYKEMVAKLEDEGIDLDTYEQTRDEVEEFITECNDIADTVENLEYPGMFG